MRKANYCEFSETYQKSQCNNLSQKKGGEGVGTNKVAFTARSMYLAEENQVHVDCSLIVTCDETQTLNQKMNLKNLSLGWRDGSLVNNTVSSYRRPAINSQHPHSG